MYPYPQQPSTYYVPVARPTSGMAVVSLVMGILAWCLVPVLGAVVAVFCGHAARAEIRRSGAAGDGMAIAGLILGWIQVVPLLLLVALGLLMGVGILFGGLTHTG